ncbi:hypothetical protein EJB05_09095, partial [Eragrostis curvula]
MSRASGTHVFEVIEYSLERWLDAGSFLCSDTFDVGGYAWTIRFHPGGRGRDGLRRLRGRHPRAHDEERRHRSELQHGAGRPGHRSSVVRSQCTLTVISGIRAPDVVDEKCTQCDTPGRVLENDDTNKDEVSSATPDDTSKNNCIENVFHIVDKCSKPEHLSFYQNFTRKFFDYDLVFFPLLVTNESGTRHWIVVVMCTRKMEFQVLDSGWNFQQYQSTVQSLVEGMSQMTSMARMAYPSLPNDVAAWKIREIKNVPKQTDRCSCGVYIIKYMQCWDGGYTHIKEQDGFCTNLLSIKRDCRGKRRCSKYHDIDKAMFDTRRSGGVRFWTWHLSRFKKRSELEASPFLRDDRLVIECTLTVISGILSPDDVQTTMPRTKEQTVMQWGLPIGLGWMQGPEEDLLARRIAAWSPFYKAHLEGLVKEATAAREMIIRNMLSSAFRTLITSAFYYNVFGEEQERPSGSEPTTGEKGTRCDSPRLPENDTDMVEMSYSTPDGTNNNSCVKIAGATVAERVKQNGRKRKMPSNLTDPTLLPKKPKAARVCPKQEKVNKLDDLREKAAIQYIQILCSSKESDGKLVYKSHRGSLVASAMRCLVDEPAKGLTSNIIDAYTAQMKPHTQGSRLLCPVWYGEMMVDKQRLDKCSRPEHLCFYQDFARKFFDYDLVLDSAWNLQRYRSTVESLVQGIAQMTSMARIAYPSLPNDVATWTIKKIKNVPKQTDRCSCGVFIIKYMQCWNGTKMRPYFTQEDINMLRKKIVPELIFSQSNEVAEAKEDVRKIMTIHKACSSAKDKVVATLPTLRLLHRTSSHTDFSLFTPY